MKFITRYWYQPELDPPAYLKILSRLFSAISHKRRLEFKNRKETEYRSPVPVIVIGNISVGGTGKTPLLISLANHLKQNDFNVGIISRGYGGKAKQWPCEVTVDSKPILVGDEPMLIALQTQCPMFVGADRNADIKALLKKYPDINVILSDDGMQHYQMQRDIEIAVIDSKRLFGNKRLLPAGPLREPVSRLDEVDIQVFNGDAEIGDNEKCFTMQLNPDFIYQLHDESRKNTLNALAGTKIHAIAGIGNPQRFFDMLSGHGLDIIPHPFDDHYQYQKSDLDFNDTLPLIMTEKDAVKCKKIQLNDCWVVSLDTQFSDGFYENVLRLLSLTSNVQLPNDKS